MDLEHHNHACHCGHDHGQEAAHSCALFQNGALNDAAAAFLQLLKTHHFLPCARFILKSTTEPSFSSVALAPVFIRDGEESVGVLRATGDMLLELEAHGYISIDYDIPLDGYDYTHFKDSRAYQLFVQTVMEGKDRPGFLGDTPTIELGSIAPIA